MRGWSGLIGLAVGMVGCAGGRRVPASWEQATQECAVVPVAQGTLRAEAAAAGLVLGVAVEPPSPRRLSAWDAVLREEFGGVTPEWVMKWAPLQPGPGVWDFSRSDPLVVCAVERDQRVKGHALTWYQSTPTWLDDRRVELADHLVAHISSVVGRYRERVLAWDVVNEVLDDEGRLRMDLLRSELGPEWLDLAFHTAHAADPRARLLYNETGIARLGGKQDGAVRLVEGLLERGVPLHAVGLQLHQHGTHPVGPTELRAALARFASLGVAVELSEIDVSVAQLAGGADTWDQAQAVIVGETVAACVDEPACDAVTFWGLSDGESWLRDEVGGGRDRPLLYDQRFRAKPGRQAVVDAFRGERPEVCEVVWEGMPEAVTGGQIAVDEAAGEVWAEDREEAWHGPALDITDLVNSGQIWQVRAELSASEAARLRLTLRVRSGGEDRFHRLGAVEVDGLAWSELETVLALPSEAGRAQELVLYAEGAEPGERLGVRGLRLASYCPIGE